MKTNFLLRLLFTSLLFHSAALARPVDLSIPEGGFGPATLDGAAQAWLEIAEFEFGEGLALPMRLHFQSSADSLREFGAGGWSSPVFQSRAFRRESGNLQVMLPCGKQMILRPQADGTFADGEWIGKVNAEGIKVEREDGWLMEFNSAGYLVKLRTDEARVIEWVRTQKSHLLVSIIEREAGGAVKTGLSVKRENGTQRVLEVEMETGKGKQSYFFRYDKQNRLVRLGHPNTRADEVNWQADKDGNPGLELKRLVGGATLLSWGTDNRKLRWDGVWTYEQDTTAPGFPRITRTGPYGEVEVHHDTRHEDGRLTFVSADGTTTIRHHLVGGLAHGKLEQVTRKLAGAEAEEVRYRAVYDARGLLAEEYDALGRKTAHAYELLGANAQSGIKRHITTSPLGAVTEKQFNRHGSVLTEKDALGHTTTYEYDRRHRRTRTLGPGGVLVERVTYTPQGRIASRTDALGATTRYQYDKRGNRTVTIDALGQETRDEYDEQDHRIKSTDPLGRTWTFAYDTAGRLISQKDPQGVEVLGHTYDSQGRRLTTTDAAGNVTAMTYDLHGRVTSRRDALERLTRYEYDVKRGAHGCTSCSASAQATTVISPSGTRTTRQFDPDQRVIEEAVFKPEAKQALQVTRYEYDAAGQLTAVIDGLGRSTRFEYDADGRRIRTLNPDQSERRYVYNARGQLVEETDEAGATSKRGYDAFGNLVALTDAEGNTLQTLFEAPAGSAISMAAARRPTGIQQASGRRNHIEYDLLGRRVALTNGYGTPDAASSRHEYDAAGNEVVTTSPTGQVTRHEYDVRNRRIKTTDALGRVWRFEYAATSGASGPAGCCGASPGGNTQAAVTIHPDGSRETRVTDAAGQLTSTTDAKGDTIQYRYSPDGRLAELIDGKGSVTKWRYDARGKLLAKTYPDGGTELYEHDAAGQMIRRVRPDGTGALHAYDLRGRLLSVKWDGDRAAPSEFGYDAAGRMTLARNPSASVERAYTATGRLAGETQVVTLEGAAVKEEKSAIGYAYDADGRLSVI